MPNKEETMKSSLPGSLFIGILIIIFLLGCTAPPSVPTLSPAASPTWTPAFTQTLTPTITQTPTPAPTITPMGSFLDNLDSYDTTLFTKADGWTNGDPFNAGWRADHINFSNGIMTITLDDLTCPSGCSGKPYASDEYRTNNLYGYGLYEGRIKSAKASGIVGGSFFTYTGPYDNQPWDEIDIEFLGKDTTIMQTNYFTNGVGDHGSIIELGFDSSMDFHTYGIEYQPTFINWYVDGKLVHTENGSRGALPSHKMKLMLNLWPGIGVDGWIGPFTYNAPINVQVDWIKYTP
jgi:endo-1,3-1,4-beta-glycanase ExoK